MRKCKYTTFEACAEVAKKYTTIKELRKNNGSCYAALWRNGWLKYCDWFDRTHYWKNGKEKEVAQYTADGKFIRKYDNACQAAIDLGLRRKEGWNILLCCKGNYSISHGYRWLYVEDMDRSEELFKERVQKKSETPYTEEMVLAKAAKYKTRKEFREKELSHYEWARRNGILDKLPFGRELNPYIDNLYCVYSHEFKETNSVYVGITFKKERRKKNHRKKGSSVYSHAVKNGIEIPDPRYIEENLSPNEALIKEDYYKEKYRREGWNIINKAKTGLASGSIGTMRTRLYSRKKVIEAVTQCETVMEFKRRFPAVYDYAHREGYVEELKPLKYAKAKDGTYNERACYEAAMGYTDIGLFRKEKRGYYHAARQKGWLKQYWWLSDQRIMTVLSCQGFKIKLFNSLKRAAESINEKPFNFDKLVKQGKKAGVGFHKIDMNDIELDVPCFNHRFVI